MQFLNEYGGLETVRVGDWLEAFGGILEKRREKGVVESNFIVYCNFCLFGGVFVVVA